MGEDMWEQKSQDDGDRRLHTLLSTGLELAVQTLGFDAATLTARQGSDLATLQATDRRLVALDDAQYESGAGPCIAVLDRHEPIYLEDATEPDGRWMHFARTAEHLGVASSLSLHLPVEGETVAGSLNLYARRRVRLGDEDIRAALPFAAHVAAAVESIDAYRSTVKLAQNMAEAMRSRAVIEQAKGMLMAEHQVDADQAFTMLVKVSQRGNVKLREVARRLVHSRSGSEPGDAEALPDSPEPDALDTA
ncbi:MAG TPA: GAF and ANTAR domain-containing protein [Gaiellales bacterium]